MMPRSTLKDVDQLRPHLRRLALLDGAPVWLEEGLHLAWIERVRDAPALTSGGASELPGAALIRRSATLRRPLQAVDATWLAAARRDARLLAEWPYRQRLARTSPVLRRLAGALVDPRWLAERDGRIATLATLLREGPSRAGPLALRPSVLQLLRAAHGDEAARGAAACARTSLLALDRLPPGTLPPSREEVRQARSAVLRAVETIALWFDLSEEDVVSPELATRLAGNASVLAAMSACRLQLGSALRLADLVWRGGAAHASMPHVAHLVARGLPLECVEEVHGRGLLPGLREFEHAAEARAWCGWVARLAAAARRTGVEAYLPANRFAYLGAGRGAELTALWQLAVAHRGQAQASRPDAVAVLDVVLSFFRHVPAEVAELSSALRDATPGAGCRAFPELAQWVGDTAGLDRLVTMQRLAGEEPRLSRLLRSDLDASARLARELEHLEALTDPTPAQRRRLERLREPSGGEPGRGPARTIRRLQEAADAAQSRALTVAIERLALGVLRARLGVAPARLDAAWLDAVRFQFDVRENRSLLTELLREAAVRPGLLVGRERGANREWFARAAKHISTAGWLAAREREVHVDGRVYRLSTEDDPLQVLRMGIAFGTCLSLGRGDGLAEGLRGNAASTVLNALDANKRVLYLRDEAGTIVGRKLIAISADWTLIGYKLYLALPPRVRGTVEQAVLALCEDMSRAAGARLAPSGQPEQIHPGFWYDDGAVPFSARTDAVARYCTHLGAPTHRDSYLVTLEAEAWAARERGAVADVVARLDHAHHRGPFWSDLGDWVAARLGAAAHQRMARRHCNLGEPLFRRAAAVSALAVVDVLRRTRGDACAWSEAARWAVLSRPVPGSGLAWVKLAHRFSPRGAKGGGGHVLDATRDVMPWLARAESPSQRRALGAALRDLWSRFGAADPPDVESDPKAADAGTGAERLGESALVQVELAAELDAADPAVAACALARRAVRAGLASHHALDWVREASLPAALARLEDTALDEGPESAAALLVHLPDLQTAAAFISRIVRTFPSEALRPPPMDEDDDEAQRRWEWVRRASAGSANEQRR